MSCEDRFTLRHTTVFATQVVLVFAAPFAPTASFVGRERELGELCAGLEQVVHAIDVPSLLLLHWHLRPKTSFETRNPSRLGACTIPSLDR